MKFRDLLAHGVMWAMEDCTAEDHCAGGFEVGCWEGGDFEGDFMAVADDEGGEGGVLVHDVQLGDAGDQLVIEGEDDVSFLQKLTVMASGRAVDLANHEELMSAGISGSDASDPCFRDAHDTRLRHLNSICFDVEDAELGGDVVPYLGYYGEEGRR